MVWLTGSLDGRDWAQVWPLLVLFVVLLPLVLAYGRPLRMLEMGDDAAYALGVPVQRTRTVLMLAAVLLNASATAAAGPISFVALTAPQLARRLTRATGPEHPRLRAAWARRSWSSRTGPRSGCSAGARCRWGC